MLPQLCGFPRRKHRKLLRLLHTNDLFALSGQFYQQHGNAAHGATSHCRLLATNANRFKSGLIFQEIKGAFTAFPDLVSPLDQVGMIGDPLKYPTVDRHKPVLRTTAGKRAFSRGSIAFILVHLILDARVQHGDPAVRMAKDGTGLTISMLRRGNLSRWRRRDEYPGLRKQRTILVMVGFIGGNELQVDPNRLRQVNQEAQKMAIMMIGRSQKGNEREALT